MSYEYCVDVTVWKKLPPDWSLIATSEGHTAPSGVWADFNTRYRIWQVTNSDAAKRLLWCDDLPDEPQVSDYPDLTSPRTI